MTEERKSRLIWGGLLLVGALGCASLRNNPALGITPLAIGIIDALIFVCILTAVRFSDWRMAAVIALATPVYLWAQRFLDGFMIPVDMLINMTMLSCMGLVLKKSWAYALNVVVLAAPAFAVMLLASTMAIWIVKDENVIRALIVAWNTDAYSALSLLGAALVCAPHGKKEAR